MSASDCTATAVVVPLAARLDVRLPGTTNAKAACIMLVTWLIGPQLVSPSTRRPTSMSGTDSTIATAVNHGSRSKNAYWTMISITDDSATPMPTHLSGNSFVSIAFDDIVVKVRLRVRHFST